MRILKPIRVHIRHLEHWQYTHLEAKSSMTAHRRHVGEASQRGDSRDSAPFGGVLQGGLGFLRAEEEEGKRRKKREERNLKLKGGNFEFCWA